MSRSRLVLALCVVLSITSFAVADITIHLPDGLNRTFASVAIKYDGNSLEFAPVSAQLRPYENSTADEMKGNIISGRYIPADFRFIDLWLIAAMKFQPAAFVFHSSHFVKIGGVVTLNPKLDTSAVTVPVVEVSKDDYVVIQEILSNYTVGYLNVTIDSNGVNEWSEIRRTWWFPFQVAVLVIWELVNIGLAIRIIVLKYGRNLATLCACLILTANVIRLGYAVDPFWGWLWPNGMVHMFLTTCYPWDVSAALLLGFYWIETASKSLQVSALLTRTRIPALIAIAILAIAEIFSSAFRASNKDRELAPAVSSVLYTIFGIFLIVFYIYMTVKVLRYLSSLTALRDRQKLMRSFSIRAICSIFGIFFHIIFTALTLTSFGKGPMGESLFLWATHVAVNWLSTWQLAAFSSTRNQKSSKGSSFTSKTLSGKPKSATSGSSKSMSSGSNGSNSNLV